MDASSNPSTVPWQDIFNAALANDLKTVKHHVEEKRFPLNQTNDDEETVGHIAAKGKNLVMLKYLIEKDPTILDAQDKLDETILTIAVTNGAIDLVRYLVDDLKTDIYHPHRQRFGNMAIHIAAEEGQYEVLKYLIEEKKVDVNVLNYLKEPPVFLAAEKPHMRIFKYLVEKAKADVTVLDSNNDNILYISAMKGDLKVPKYLLDEKKILFDINWQDLFGRTVVYVASRFNRLNFLKYCVEEKGANIHLASNKGWTPLFEASFVGNMDVIKYLLEKGADMYHKDKADQTVEQIAGYPHVAEFFNKTKHERSRRSIPKSLMGLASESNLISHGRTMKRLSSKESSENAVSSSQLQGFLVLADTVFRYTKNTFSQQRHEALSSPVEMIHARIDRIAVDAVQNFQNLRD